MGQKVLKVAVARKSKQVVLGVTGSIAAYKAADLIRRLQERGFSVSVIMTKEAEQFISALTLSSLAGGPVYRDWFSHQEKNWEMPHIQLAKQADLLLIAPATANIIGKMSAGIADDLLTCTFLATRAPVLIAPAMNEEMYQHAIVQENCVRLKSLGVKFVDPVQGNLACGVFGDGHLAEVEDIVKAAEKNLR